MRRDITLIIVRTAINQETGVGSIGRTGDLTIKGERWSFEAVVFRSFEHIQNEMRTVLSLGL